MLLAQCAYMLYVVVDVVYRQSQVSLCQRSPHVGQSAESPEPSYAHDVEIPISGPLGRCICESGRNRLWLEHRLTHPFEDYSYRPTRSPREVKSRSFLGTCHLRSVCLRPYPFPSCTVVARGISCKLATILREGTNRLLHRSHNPQFG